MGPQSEGEGLCGGKVIVNRLKLGILASGRGSNLQAVIDEIKTGRLEAEIKILLTDKPEAYAVERAKKNSIESLYLNPKEFISKDAYFAKISEEFRQREVELVILAGFMRIVRRPLLETFPDRIMNIHPALLPSFPGLHAQKQALDYGARITGCTVHFVDEGMDTGPIIIQAAVPVEPGDTEETLSARILEQEHRIYPEAIRLYAEDRLKIEGRAVRISGYERKEGHLVNPAV